MIGKFKVLMSLDLTTIGLLIEAFLYLGWARFQLMYLPFSKLALSLGVYMKETKVEDTESHNSKLKHIRHSIQVMSKYTFWESKCLVRAIAALKMLERRNIDSTLYLGTGTDENGKMIAHAWLRSGSMYVTGYEEMYRFTVTGKFAKMTNLVGGK
ncbi:lasso peptide biosynthesis B2 protein [Metabacillus litoralis]|uniref:lasso peptide biosynthesis B2 protein n=1 Tax=Metabacillus litoralis TaxID=152268 RepID=UPI000EF5FC36|nr:lasso peptide biosynthesis B2 protein [Metabacillus litoralis]